MHVRCPYCRQAFNLSRDYVAQALSETTEKKQKYHAVECINCRKTIKVSVDQMKRFAPSEPPPAEETESQEAGDGE